MPHGLPQEIASFDSDVLVVHVASATVVLVGLYDYRALRRISRSAMLQHHVAMHRTVFQRIVRNTRRRRRNLAVTHAGTTAGS